MYAPPPRHHSAVLAARGRCETQQEKKIVTESFFYLQASRDGGGGETLLAHLARGPGAAAVMVADEPSMANQVVQTIVFIQQPRIERVQMQLPPV